MGTVNKEHLAHLLKLNGFKNRPFAEAVGISPQYLGDILSGRSRLERRPDLIKTMAETLGVPVSMLVRSSGTALAEDLAALVEDPATLDRLADLVASRLQRRSELVETAR